MKPRKPLTSPLGCQAWVLLETLLSIMVFALISTLISQQNQHHFQRLTHLKAINQTQILAQQTLKTRALMQDFNWLEGVYETGNPPACLDCSKDALEAWFLSWNGAEGATHIFQTTDKLLKLEK